MEPWRRSTFATPLNTKPKAPKRKRKLDKKKASIEHLNSFKIWRNGKQHEMSRTHRLSHFQKEHLNEGTKGRNLVAEVCKLSFHQRIHIALQVIVNKLKLGCRSLSSPPLTLREENEHLRWCGCRPRGLGRGKPLR